MKHIIIALILLGLIWSSQATDEIDKSYYEFYEIDKDEFGKTLLDTLQIEIQNDAPLQRFLDIMREIENQIEADQKGDDENHYAFQKSCDQDLDEIQTDIHLTSLRITEIQSNFDELQNAVIKKNGLINIQKQIIYYIAMQKAKQDWLNLLNDQIDEKQRDRDTQKKEYDQKMSENSYVIYIITQVKNIFRDSQKSFLQLSSFEEGSKFLDEVIGNEEHFQVNKNYKEFFTLLNQLTMKIKEKNDTYSVERLLKLCDQLMNNIEASQSIEIRSEERREKTFNKEMDLLKKNQRNLENELAQINADKSQLDSKIQSTQYDMDDQKKRKDQKNDQLKDRKTECGQEAYTYQQNREDNDKKRGLVSQVIGLFSANQRDLKQYISQRGQM